MLQQLHMRYLISICAVAWLFVGALVHASTIENNISVSANSGNGGTGTSIVHSETIINGHTVENKTISSSDPITYQRTFLSNGSTTVVTKATTSASTTAVDQRALLQALIAKLHAYVVLLTQLMAASHAPTP